VELREVLKECGRVTYTQWEQVRWAQRARRAGAGSRGRLAGLAAERPWELA
jgi:hypothetical protein